MTLWKQQQTCENGAVVLIWFHPKINALFPVIISLECRPNVRMRWFVFSFQCYCSTRSSSYSYVPRSGNHVSSSTCGDHGNAWSPRCKFRWINRHVCRTSHPPHTRREVKDPAGPGNVQRGIWQWRACSEKVSCHSTKFISEHLLGVLAECEWSKS